MIKKGLLVITMLKYIPKLFCFYCIKKIMIGNNKNKVVMDKS